MSERAKWRSDLAKKATYKALDIPLEDGIGISVTSGLGWKEIAAGGAILIGSMFALRPSEPAVPTAPAPSVSVPDTEYEVRFFDEDGNRLPIEHRTR